MARSAQQRAIVVAQVELAVPGYPAMSGTVDIIEGEEVPTLGRVAAQVRELLEELVVEIGIAKRQGTPESPNPQ